MQLTVITLILAAVILIDTAPKLWTGTFHRKLLLLAWLTLSLWFAFPLSLVTIPYCFLKTEVFHGLGLAPWITTKWRIIAPICAMFSITSVVIIRKRNTTCTGKLFWCAFYAMALMTICESGLLLLLCGGPSTTTATGVSPDGNWRAESVLIPGWLDSSYSLILTRNGPLPLLAREVHASQAYAIAWTPDSRIVSTWHGAAPTFAYDIIQKRTLPIEFEAYKISLPNSLPVTNLISALKAAGLSAEKFLFHAATKGDLNAVQELLKDGADVNGKPGDATALSAAALSGHTDVVHILLAAGADPNTTCYAWKSTALSVAASRGYPAIVADLIKYGADVNACGDTGWSALMLAAYNGHKEIVQQLLDYGANQGLKANKGETALSLAKQKKRAAIVELLNKY